MAANVEEVAQALAVASLSNPTFINNLIPSKAERGEAGLAGRKVGEFYQAIYMAVKEVQKEHTV